MRHDNIVIYIYIYIYNKFKRCVYMSLYSVSYVSLSYELGAYATQNYPNLTYIFTIYEILKGEKKKKKKKRTN
jgi:hypothetical protein